MPQANSRVALVTGANKGIGFEIARELGKAGYTVMLGARNPELGRKAAAKLSSAQIDARFVELDVDREAGDGPPGTARLETVERTFRTNFFGALIVTQVMLPLLRKSSAGRVVNVSSGLGSLEQNGNQNGEIAKVKYLAYSASKAALNMLTVQLANELRDTGIKVNSAAPGFTATDLNQHRGHQTVEQGAAAAVHLALLAEDGPTGGFFSSTGSVPW
jgi:NAD(P)-dependent dehydrogenase (short-subunit alcohol dehydrogenase family)